MAIGQVGAVAAGIEAARYSGVQQSSQSASANAVQRQNNRTAEEADLKKTEVVEEAGESGDVSGTSAKRLDITV
ncbi:hypothetical protein [Dongia sp.]|uniref:hypothetical protein n=1 Tax=Dongia sp. TaxID=1977262 RepID=UPI0035ADF214